MRFDIQREVERMQNMTVRELREQYVKAFGEQARSGNKAFLIKRIAWRMQANLEGGLSERAKKRAAELANESDLRIRAPREPFDANEGRVEITARTTERDPRLPPPNTELTRKYKGRDYKVEVLEDRFKFDGAFFPTLSAVAKAITGTHWNGYTFFKI